MPDLLEKPKPKKGKKVDVNSLIDDSDVMVDVNDLIEKKNGTSNGLTNVEDVATTSVPSTSPLPVNDPFSFDRFVPQELEKHPEYKELPIAKRITLLPKAQSIIEAKEQDKNISGNLWNSLVSGVASLGAGIADIHAIITSDDVKAQRETIAKQREAFSEQFGADVTTEEKAAFDENLITSTAGSLVNMIPGIPGKGVGLFIMAYDNAGQSIEQSPKGKDLPESTKTIYKATVGTTVGAMDRIPILKLFFGKQTDKVAAGITTKVLTNLIKTSKVPITAEMAQAAITAELKSLKNTIIQGGKKVATGAGLESITETGQEGFTMFAEEVLNKAQGEEVFEEKSWQDNLVRLGRSAAGGALGGTALGGLSIPFNKTRDYISEKVAAAKTPEDLTALKAELMDAAESQKLSQPELDELGKTIDNYVRVNQKIPSDQTDARKEIAEKIIEREEIENEVTKKLEEVVSVDEAFKPAIREESEALKGRVEEINDEIKNLAEPRDTKLSEPIEGLDEQEIPIGENVPQPTGVSKKKIFTDFDDTVWDNKTQKLTPLGEELKAKIAAGEDVEVLTKRESTEENINFISDKLGIDKSKIKAGLQAEDKGAIVDAESGDKVYYNENQQELDAAKTGQKINVTDSNAPLLNQRSEEDISNIIKAPVPRGNLKRMEVQVKSIDPETNEVTLTTMQAKKAVVDLKKQVGIIDMIKKCL